MMSYNGALSGENNLGIGGRTAAPNIPFLFIERLEDCL
jgi:hypothetical protein